MAKSVNLIDCDDFGDSLYNILRDCTHRKSTDTINESFADSIEDETLCDYFNMLAITDDTIDSSTESYSVYENLLEEDGRISLAYENLKSIPKEIAEKYSGQMRHLDLSHNNFRNLTFLTFFKGLHTLILDRNINLDESTLPYLPNLNILWINNCNINSIPKWIYRIQTQCPSLQHLSMMGNSGACSLLNGFSTNENSNYRKFVFNILRNLSYLDGVPHERILNKSNKLYSEKAENYSQGRDNIRNTFPEIFSFGKFRQKYNSSSTS